MNARGHRGVPRKILGGDTMGMCAGTSAGTWLRRDGVMTASQHNDPTSKISSRSAAPGDRPLRQLEAHLAARARSPEGRAAMTRLERAGVALGDSEDLVALARSCHAGGDAAHAAAVIRALSALVPEDELAGLCLLAAFAPALADMARWLVAHGQGREDAEATAIAALWAGACAPGPHEGRCLYRAAWNALRRANRHEALHYAVGRHHDALEDALDACNVVPEVADDPALLLADALRAGALRPDQAALLHALYVDDVPAWRVAVAQGRSVRALSLARRRAERALGEFMTREEGE